MKRNSPNAGSPKQPRQADRFSALNDDDDHHNTNADGRPQRPHPPAQPLQPSQGVVEVPRPAHLQPAYRPTDETDLIGDQQQVRLLEPNGRGQQKRAAKSGASFSFAATMLGNGKRTGPKSQSQQQQQQQRQGAKKSAAGADGAGLKKTKNNNNNNSLSADIEAAHSPKRAINLESERGHKWLFMALMALLVVLSIAVILLLSFTNFLSFEDEDLCLENQPFQASSYKLFATKTLYTTAYNLLSLVPIAASYAPPPPPSLAQLQATNGSSQQEPMAASLVSIAQPLASNGANPTTPQQQPPPPLAAAHLQYDRSSIHRPKFFAPNETLETLHKRLTAPQLGCQSRELYFFGRHAARLPSANELERLANALEGIRKRIDLSRAAAAAPAAAQDGAPQPTPSSAANEPTPNTTNSSGGGAPPAATNSRSACLDPLAQFVQWRMFATDFQQQGNLITEVGAYETGQIAQRFKRLHPHLFDQKQSAISIATTSEIRTAQTAVEFLRHLDNLDVSALDICPLNEFPRENSRNPEAARTINNNYCYQRLLKTKENPALSFHHRCKSATGKLRLTLNPADHTAKIRESVSRKLKLVKEKEMLSHDEMKTLYDLCKYESAQSGEGSIWCNLFTPQQMRLLEYLADIEDFYESAYNSPLQSQSACALTKDMLKHFGEILTMSSAEKRPLTNRLQLHFTHSEALQKLIAATVEYLRAEEAFQAANVRRHLAAGEAPRERNWQTSLLTPFSANIAFTLYECPASAHKNELDLDRPPYRVVASLNEQPIMVESCRNYDCRLGNLFYHARMAKDSTCDLDSLCPT